MRIPRDASPIDRRPRFRTRNPANMREKIFERFWKGDNSKEGAGLGLAIVRRVMSMR